MRRINHQYRWGNITLIFVIPIRFKHAGAFKKR
jgi:hypothetical protein